MSNYFTIPGPAPHMAAQSLLRDKCRNKTERKAFDSRAEAEEKRAGDMFYSGDWAGLRKMSQEPDLLPVTRAFLVRFLSHPDATRS